MEAASSYETSVWRHAPQRHRHYHVILVLAESLLGSGTDDDDDDDNSTSTTATTTGLKHQHTGGAHAGATPEANNNSLAPGDMAPIVGGPGSLNDGKTGQDDSEDQGKYCRACGELPQCVALRHVRHEPTVTAVLPRIQVLYDVTLCRWVIPDVSEDSIVFIFNDDAVKKSIHPSKLLTTHPIKQCYIPSVYSWF